MKFGGREQRTRCVANPFFRDFAILRINFYANGVSSPFCRGNRGRARSHEGIQHRVPYEGKHPNQTFDEFFGVRCRVQSG